MDPLSPVPYPPFANTTDAAQGMTSRTEPTS